MADNSKKTDWSHLAWGIGGAAIGSLWVKNQADEAKKSRAERDNPDEVEEICLEIGELLEDWEPDEECETEDDFMRDLWEYLDENSEWEIEMCPDTPEGKPDILVGDSLAIELKVSLSKVERDRLIGQCAGYSRLWVTWAVVVGASDSKIGRLIDLLEDKGLEQISVWSF